MLKGFPVHMQWVPSALMASFDPKPAQSFGRLSEISYLREVWEGSAGSTRVVPGDWRERGIFVLYCNAFPGEILLRTLHWGACTDKEHCLDHGVFSQTREASNIHCLNWEMTSFAFLSLSRYLNSLMRSVLPVSHVQPHWSMGSNSLTDVLKSIPHHG